MSIVVQLSGSSAQVTRTLAALGRVGEVKEKETPERAVIGFSAEFLIAQLKDRLKYENPQRTLHCLMAWGLLASPTCPPNGASNTKFSAFPSGSAAFEPVSAWRCLCCRETEF
jgi:hypothetical protein